jgi:hypothetical protein
MFRRALLLLAAIGGSFLVSAAPALALYREDGDEPGTGLTVLETLAYFVGAPVLLYLVITVIVMAATGKRGGGVAELDRIPLSNRD